MQKAESVHENEMHKILWDFEIKTDDQIVLTRKKKPCHGVDFVVPVNLVKIKGIDYIGKYLDLAKNLKNLEHGGERVIRAFGMVLKGVEKRQGNWK